MNTFYVRKNAGVVNKQSTFNASYQRWESEVKETGLLISSMLPDHVESDTKCVVEGMVLDKSLSTKCITRFDGMLLVSPRLGLLDMGVQHWRIDNMRAFLHWMQTVQSIHYLKLDKAIFSIGAWEMFFAWLTARAIRVADIHLGSCSLTLSKVKVLSMAIASMRVIEKIDFANTKWTDAQLKVFSWSYQSSNVLVKRCSLGRVHASDFALCLLVKTFACYAKRCMVLSLGHSKRSPVLSNLFMDIFTSRPCTIRSVLFHNQVFDTKTTVLMHKLLSSKGLIVRIAFIDCQWDCTVFDQPLSQTNVQKIYFEKGSMASGGLISLVALGYKIHKEISSNAFWLEWSGEQR